MTRFTHCIVHAGTHKTGTTTVQNILAAHRTQLAASGFLYPAMGRKGKHHNPLAHGWRPARTTSWRPSAIS